MIDSDILQEVLKERQLAKAFAYALKQVWALRELDFIKATGFSGPCDCLFYRDGDYADALRTAREAMAR